MKSFFIFEKDEFNHRCKIIFFGLKEYKIYLFDINDFKFEFISKISLNDNYYIILKKQLFLIFFLKIKKMYRNNINLSFTNMLIINIFVYLLYII